MYFPQFDKAVKQPKYWLMGLMAMGVALSVVAIPSASQLFWRQGRSGSDVSALTLPVSRQDITRRITGSGTVQPVRTVNISPKTAGRVIALYVDQGDRVTQGQLLARMDDRDLQAEQAQAQANVATAQARLATLENPTRPELIQQAQAGVAQAQAELRRAEGEVVRAQGAVADAESQLVLASRQLQRQQALADQGAIALNSLDEFVRREQNARQTLNQARAQLSQAQAQVVQAQAAIRSAAAQRQQQDRLGSQGEIEQAQAQLQVAQAQLLGVQTRLRDTEIRAPFDGQVTQRYATVGAFVTPTTQASAVGTGATSTSIVALANDLEVLAEVPEIDIAQIRSGQEVEIRADAYPDQTFRGRVQLVAPEAVVDQNVTYFQVRVQLLSGQEALRSGMNVDLNFLGAPLPQALLVPTVAIVTKQGQTGVLVPNAQNKPEFKPVTIGVTVKDQTQVLDGLQEGDLVFKELPKGMKLEQILQQGMGGN
jgi:HlyD family secretion protein